MAKTVFIYSQEEHVSFTGDEFRSAKWKPFVFRSQSSAQCCSRSDQCWRPHWRNSQHCAQEPGAAVLTHRSSSAEGLRRSSWLGRLWARLSDPASDSTSRLKVLSNSPFLLKLDCVQLRILWYWNTVLYHLDAVLRTQSWRANCVHMLAVLIWIRYFSSPLSFSNIVV